MLLGNLVDDADKLVDVLIVDGNLHALAAQHIGGAHQHRIAELGSCPFGLLGSEHGMARRPGNPALLQNRVEALSVLRRVHVLRRGAQDGNAHLHQGLGELDGGLAAELNHRAVRLLHIHDALHILRGQGLKIQLVRDIKIRTHGLRIIVDDDGLIALFAESPGAVHGTEVKLNSLADADGAGAENQNLFASLRLLRLIDAAEAGVVIGRLRLELCGAGVHHLVGGPDVVVVALLLDLLLGNTCQAGNHIVRELDALGFCQKLGGELPLSGLHSLQNILHLH